MKRFIKFTKEHFTEAHLGTYSNALHLTSCGSIPFRLGHIAVQKPTGLSLWRNVPSPFFRRAVKRFDEKTDIVAEEVGANVVSVGFKSPSKKEKKTLRSFWCALRDLNPHALALEPKSSVSANSTKGAYIV